VTTMIPHIDPDVKYWGVSRLRKLNSKTLRELPSAVVIQDNGRPLAVIVSYEMFLRIQSERLNDGDKDDRQG
jgi:hypothetical protein